MIFVKLAETKPNSDRTAVQQMKTVIWKWNSTIRFENIGPVRYRTPPYACRTHGESDSRHNWRLYNDVAARSAPASRARVGRDCPRPRGRWRRSCRQGFDIIGLRVWFTHANSLKPLFKPRKPRFKPPKPICIMIFVVKKWFLWLKVVRMWFLWFELRF